MNLLPLATLALRFGRVNRATFHPDGVRPETDAEHSIMLVLLAIEIAARHPELGLNAGLLALYGVVHDLPEAYAGDTNTVGGLSEAQRAAKEAREAAALAQIGEETGHGEVWQACVRYEKQNAPEARFLRYLDKITPKLTHTLNGTVALRRMGKEVAWLRQQHRAQGGALAAAYPEFASVLGPLFDEVCAASEEALVRSPREARPCEHSVGREGYWPGARIFSCGEPGVDGLAYCAEHRPPGPRATLHVDPSGDPEADARLVRLYELRGEGDILPGGSVNNCAQRNGAASATCPMCGDLPGGCLEAEPVTIPARSSP